jgi:hypothetical protein
VPDARLQKTEEVATTKKVTKDALAVRYFYDGMGQNVLVAN